jgi:glycine cleavage system transcriptional repressor
VPHYAVSVIGRDRPGIVAALSGALLGVEGNIEDSRMAILRGHFAVMLIVAAPDGVDRAQLEARLGPLREELGLEAISVGEIEELAAAAPGATHVLTVYGADHPGIVHAIATALAQRGGNITDLQTRLMGEADKPLYVMMMELALGEGSDAEELEKALLEVGERAKVDVSLRRLEVEAL